MYSVEDLIWIKNIKRKKGASWAYDNVSCGSTFLLNWSSSKQGSAKTPKVGDIIALFQRPNMINGKKNNKVHLTHLVSPISDEIIEDLNSPEHKWCRRVELIAFANPIDSIPNPGHYSFFLPNRGLTNPIINLENNLGLTVAETQTEVWNLFSPHFCIDVGTNIFIPQEPVGIFGEIEGDKIIREHITQELLRRNSGIVQSKKNEALRSGNGKILCECCQFDFLEVYGQHGYGFIECHHKIHLATGERLTTLEDLALICSNCHRMLHRKNDGGNYHSVEDLKNLIDLPR